jgi:hypothetical protein
MECYYLPIFAGRRGKMKLWRVRIVAKLVLSRLPFHYREWAKIGLFKHGAMDDYLYAWNILKTHSSCLAIKDEWRGLELGPGDSLLSSLLAPALGSKGLTLCDAGDFANKDVNLYRERIDSFLLHFTEVVLPKIMFDSDINDMLSSVNGGYYSKGLMSLRVLKASSYDLIYSQAVLEHVRLDEFEDTLKECYRLLDSKGVMSHVVDFKDHLGGGLNNMRFSSLLWERDWFAKESGFYTNRIRLSEMISICENIGFNVEVISKRCWRNLPIKRVQLAREYCNLSDNDLLISGAHLVMRKKA